MAILSSSSLTERLALFVLVTAPAALYWYDNTNNVHTHTHVHVRAFDLARLARCDVEEER